MPLVALAPPGGSNDLDRYELLFRFAAGGMAEVFVARQRGEGGFLRPVAIKRMLPALAEEPKFVEMFLDEARLAALVQSPYVVPTLDCGKDEEGSPYIVMELVVGVSLSQALRGAVEKRKHVPPAVMAEVIGQTALGLYDAHHARTPTGQPLEIVHRDVSPQNILIGVDGRARLTDFGVARALERVSRTSTGEVKGKLSYFSPEQARMEHLDQRSDIFALGVVAWEMLVLERLFSRDNPMAALQAVLQERIPDVRELNPDIPERLALVVARALERDLSLRYQTARDFADDLRAAVGKPATAGEIGAWVEEGGGPRLATFRKKIETAFTREARTEIEIAVPHERDRSGSVRSAATPSGISMQSAPESHVVGVLGTLPDQAVQEIGSQTLARSTLEPPTRAIRPAGQSGSTPRLLIVDEPDQAVAPAAAPRSSARILAAAGAASLVLLGGAAGLYVFSAPNEEPAPAPSAVIAAPVPAVTAAAPASGTPAATAPIPTGVLPTETPAARPAADRRPGRRTGGGAVETPALAVPVVTSPTIAAAATLPPPAAATPQPVEVQPTPAPQPPEPAETAPAGPDRGGRRAPPTAVDPPEPSGNPPRGSSTDPGPAPSTVLAPGTSSGRLLRPGTGSTLLRGRPGGAN